MALLLFSLTAGKVYGNVKSLVIVSFLDASHQDLMNQIPMLATVRVKNVCHVTLHANVVRCDVFQHI